MELRSDCFLSLTGMPVTGDPATREPMEVEPDDNKTKLEKLWPWSRGQAEASEREETEMDISLDRSLDRTLRPEELSELEASYRGDAKRRHLPELPRTPEKAQPDFPTYPLPALLFEKEKREAEAERKYREKAAKEDFFNKKCEVIIILCVMKAAGSVADIVPTKQITRG